MAGPKPTDDPEALKHILAGARQQRAKRGNLYRERALKLLPWICAWCGREFSSKKLHELTVHHKDRNHNNNPPDGSNWELLCLYCHDSEHSRTLEDGTTAAREDDSDAPTTYKAFAGIESLIKKK